MTDIVHGRTMEWSASGERHREGQLAFKRLFHGDEGDPANYRLVLSRNDGGYRSPRHRHNFDQIRYCVAGRLSIAPGIDMEAGDAGFFPEGAWYGPQTDGPEERLALVLQFGGASGGGFLSAEELVRGRDALGRRGRFGDGLFRPCDGGPERDAYEAIWEHVTGRTLDYPAPRYPGPVIARSGHFGWVAEAEGVARKALGSFTEREVRMDRLRLTAGVSRPLGGDALLLAFVLDGAATCAGATLGRHDAIRVPPGETATLAATGDTDLFAVTLPPLPGS